MAMTRLHYLYEQLEGNKERFVYYCSSCRCILRVRRDLGPTGETIDYHNGRCVGCGRILEDNVECRLAAVPDDWSDAYPTRASQAERNRSEFRSASSFPHFSLGFSALDAMLRPFSPERLIVLSGAHSSVVAELAAFRAQLPLEMGGLDSAVLFIDGGNRSDPYLFSSFAKQWGFKPKAAMRRVTTCRVFTMYQLADLVSEHLVPAVADYATKLVVFPDLLGTFNEPELDDREARRLLSAIEQGIMKAKKHAMVLVTLDSQNKHDETVTSWADTTVNLSSSGGRVRAELLKHQRMPPSISTFRQSHLLVRRRMKATS